MPLPLDAPVIDDPYDYVGRPGLSPVLAALVAAGDVRPRDRVLDLGCGRGTDLVALAELGFSRLEGIDRNRASLRAARRAERGRGLDVVTWRSGSLADLASLDGGAYDVAFETFLTNNLHARADAPLLRAVARLLRRGGLFVSQRKLWPREEPAPLASPLFRAGPVVRSHLPERGRRGGRSWEPVAVQVLRRR